MKLILYMAMTVNGMIAKENGETPWSDEEWQSYADTVERTNAIIIGRKTFEIMEKEDSFEKIGNPFTIVLTNKKLKNKGDFIFVSSAKEAVTVLKEKKFDKALIAGGAQINSLFMKENLVDEIYLDIEPLVFGKGIGLFADGDFEKRLGFIGSRKISGNVIQLHYRVNR